MGDAILSAENRLMVHVGDFAELEEGKLKLVRAAHARLLVVRIGDGVRALSAMCTHARIFLAPGHLTPQGLIECPMHGALFSPEDGAVRCAPATKPLTVHEVRLVGGGVYVDPGPEPEAAPDASTKPGARPSAAQWGNWG